MSARRHHSQVRRRPRRDELAGVDDSKVTAAGIQQELEIRGTKLSDIKAAKPPLTRVKH